MTTIIGISGKMGAGKDYLASHLISTFESHGYKVGVSSFAAPLKAEMNAIIARYSESTESLAAAFTMPVEQMAQIKAYIADDYAERGVDLNAYDRTPGMRSALQYLGTEVRRKVDEQHWVKQYISSVDTTLDFSFVTDARFSNEADAVVDNGGVMVRLEISPELLRERAIKRDGFAYDANAHAHPSEVALDGYERFSLVLGDTYQIAPVATQVLGLSGK